MERYSMVSFVAVVAISLAAVTAQERCCTASKQFEMEVGLSSISFGAQQDAAITGLIPRVSVDVTNKRIALAEWLFGDGKLVLNITTVVDYTKQLAYVVTWADARGTAASCNKVKIAQPMESNCIPADARYSGSGVLGSGPSALKYDAWTIDRPGMAVYATVQKGTCVAVSQSGFTGTKEGAINFVGAMYSNFSPGFKDRGVFNIPSFCRTASVVERDVLTDTARHVLDKFSAGPGE